MTAEQTARVVRDLHWVCDRLFALLGDWAARADRPELAVSMATSSRHLGWHVTDLAELVPDSVLLSEVEGAAAGSPALAAALDAIAAIPGSAEHLAVTHRVLLARVAAQCVAVDRLAAAHSDGALHRVLSFLLADLRRDRDEGELLLERLLGDPAVFERVHERVLEAERRLVEVGGLFPEAPPT